MITKGDEELSELQTAVSSVNKYVDHVCITTNGKTTEKTKQFCKKNGFKHSHLDWNDDFSAQRNFNFAQAPKDTDFILWIDSDDVVVNPQLLREIAQKAKDSNKSGVLFTYWYSNLFKGEPSIENHIETELEQTRERLLKPGTTTWKNMLHETPVPVEGAKYDYVVVPYNSEQPIAVMHLGAHRGESQDVSQERTMRNKRILEKQLKTERANGEADPRTLLYLMKIYVQISTEELLKECIHMGNEYLTKSGWDEERALACSLIAQSYGKMGDHKTAKTILHKAIEEFPYDPLLYLTLSEACFNLGLNKQMKHWLDIAMSLDIDKAGKHINNLFQMKVLSAELVLKYYFNVDRNTKKALNAAKTLYSLHPTENNKANITYLEDLEDLNEACKNTDLLSRYLESIGEGKAVLDLIESLPQAIKDQQFAHKLKIKHSQGRVWGKDEICYYASFGGKHFEEWSPNNLDSGIGGSETSVIELAKEWTKLGYKVTVYGDPGKAKGDHDGVTYLPWYQFNIKDKFNIFIQWRSNALAGLISSKKYMVDLHDVWNSVDFVDKLDSIDKIMVKSEYHRSLAPNIPDDKFLIVSNGLRS